MGVTPSSTGAQGSQLTEAKSTPWLRVLERCIRKSRQDSVQNRCSEAKATRRHTLHILSYLLSNPSIRSIYRSPTSMMDTIGLVSDAITIVSFFGDLIPSAASDKGTQVTVKAGLGGINSDEADHVSLTIVSIPRIIAELTPDCCRVAKSVLSMPTTMKTNTWASLTTTTSAMATPTLSRLAKALNPPKEGTSALQTTMTVHVSPGSPCSQRTRPTEAPGLVTLVENAASAGSRALSRPGLIRMKMAKNRSIGPRVRRIDKPRFVATLMRCQARGLTKISLMEL